MFEVPGLWTDYDPVRLLGRASATADVPLLGICPCEAEVKVELDLAPRRPLQWSPYVTLAYDGGQATGVVHHSPGGPLAWREEELVVPTPIPGKIMEILETGWVQLTKFLGNSCHAEHLERRLYLWPYLPGFQL
jgi:hypothetical protein